MLNRLTVSALLKTVIIATSFCIVVAISLNAWDSWGRLRVASRISVIADASANLFKAMHNLRTDQSTTFRLLNADQPMAADIEKYLRDLRDAQMPAMANALGLLPSIEFAQQNTLVPELDRLFKRLTALQKEFWDEVGKPKASRRASMPQEYYDITAASLQTLDKLSAALAAAVNHQDATIDQLLAIKQSAWLLRNTAGEASLLISKGLAAGRVAPEARLIYTKFLGGTEIAFTALEMAASGMQLPQALSIAIAATKTAYFEPDYLALRDRLLTVLIAGEKPELTANQWSPITVGRMGSAVTVAERALDAAKEHALVQHSAAQRSLVLQLTLLAAAFALTFGAMMAVTRRVITPLHNMRDAMLKVAAGDLTVDTGYTERKDEIGALAGALETFKQQAADKVRIEAQERERNAGAMTRQNAIESYVGEFETMVRQTLDQLGDASGQMRTTSSELSSVSRQTNERVQVAEKASGEASMSVDSVAAASEELSASINDISQQAAHAAGIASRAVGQARENRRHRAGVGQIGGPDRRSRRPDQHHRGANQSAGAERHHRSRPRR
jgi:methyl-accepting chemotaxis protein